MTEEVEVFINYVKNNKELVKEVVRGDHGSIYKMRQDLAEEGTELTPQEVMDSIGLLKLALDIVQ